MISIVIPAYNEEKLIGACLDALTQQKTTKKFEVILVDNNSTDKTVIIAEKYKNKLDLKIVLQKVKGRGPARQRGFQEAKGKIIFSTDADTIVPPCWIERLSKTLQESTAVGVTGTCKIVDCGWFTNTCFNFIQPFSMRIYRLIFGHYWFSGFNFAIYKDIYEKSGGFNARLNVQEDSELSFKVSKIGKIKFIPNVPVIFSGRRFQNGLLKGLLPYLTTFIGYFHQKNEQIVLDDVR